VFILEYDWAIEGTKKAVGGWEPTKALFGSSDCKPSRKISRTGLSDSYRFTQTSWGRNPDHEWKLVIKMVVCLFQLQLSHGCNFRCTSVDCNKYWIKTSDFLGLVNQQTTGHQNWSSNSIGFTHKQIICTFRNMLLLHRQGLEQFKLHEILIQIYWLPQCIDASIVPDMQTFIMPLLPHLNMRPLWTSTKLGLSKESWI
jgi:hypothetical protein